MPNNAISLGFMSVLLALVMYFAFLSVQKDQTTVNIGTISACPGMCCLTRCETHKVEVVDAHYVRFEHGVLSADEFANHLQLAHNECEVQLVNVWAAQAVPHEMVLNISNRVREVAPNSVIAWGNVEH
jgi:hypothetical protein